MLSMSCTIAKWWWPQGSAFHCKCAPHAESNTLQKPLLQCKLLLRGRRIPAAANQQSPLRQSSQIVLHKESEGLLAYAFFAELVQDAVIVQIWWVVADPCILLLQRHHWLKELHLFIAEARGLCCLVICEITASASILHRDDEGVLEDEPMAPSNVFVEELEGSTVAA